MTTVAGRRPFKEALRSKTTRLGLWVGLTDPVAIEIAAGAGFDWILLDGEHAPFDLRAMLTGLQVAAAYPVDVLVRVPDGDPTRLKQVLDIGATTVVVPTVETAAEAEALVSAVRYPPAGRRGVGTALARAARWNRIPGYLASADAGITLIVQVESVRGLENLGAIAAVPGVDAVLLGPSDLAASMGMPGQSDHDQVQSALAEAYALLARLDVPSGTLTGDLERARAYVAAGCRFIALGCDTTLLSAAMRSLRERFTGA